MNDLEKARLLYQMSQAPGMTDEALENIRNSISPKIRSRIDRIMASFRQEDIFRILYGALPWTHLLHSVDETQQPASSKAVFQVPDTIVFYKDTKQQYLSLLIDVKTVLGDKQTLKNVQIEQSKILARYAKVLRSPLLYAIYWDKIQTWTLNCLDHFEEKSSSFKISLADAFVNDLSSILGDITYVFPKGYKRLSKIDPKLKGDDEYCQHQVYGGVVEESISFDGQNFIPIDVSESAIIDSTTTMTQISQKLVGDVHLVVEEAAHPLALKISTLILRYLAIFNRDPEPEAAQMASKIIQNFFLRLNALSSTMIPRDRNDYCDRLYFRSFAPGYVFNNYRRFHNLNFFKRLQLRFWGGDFA